MGYDERNHDDERDPGLLMRIAMLSPVAWRTPPRHYGPWEQVAYNITEGLVRNGIDVTLFATRDSFTAGKLDGVVERSYEEDKNQDAKVFEGLHIAAAFERAAEFDLLHNHFDFLPLTYSSLVRTPMVTTIEGFSSERILPVYQKYNDTTHYISVSNANRHPSLRYLATIYHGIRREEFDYVETPEDYLLFFGRIHPDKGPHEAITIAKAAKRKLILAGIIQDRSYFKEKVEPFIDGDQIVFLGHAGPERRKALPGNAAALLHPIGFVEPFGLSVAESMFCGTPVIAYNRGSMPELIVDGVSGFLVRHAEEAVTAVGALSQVSRRRCFEHATANFGVDRMVDGYIAAYRTILES